MLPENFCTSEQKDRKGTCRACMCIKKKKLYIKHYVKGFGKEKVQKCRQSNWFSAMISDSKKTDRMAERQWQNAEYINAEFLHTLVTQQNKSCIYCKNTMIFGSGYNRSGPYGLTLRRINKDNACIQSNVVLSCRKCTRIAANSIPHTAMLQYGFDLHTGVKMYCPYVDHVGERLLEAGCFSGIKAKNKYCRKCQSMYEHLLRENKRCL